MAKGQGEQADEADNEARRAAGNNAEVEFVGFDDIRSVTADDMKSLGYESSFTKTTWSTEKGRKQTIPAEAAELLVKTHPKEFRLIES